MKITPEGNCERVCPQSYHMSPTSKTCTLGCPYGEHSDWVGFCVEGCPGGEGENWAIDKETGKCYIEIYNSEINWEYVVIIACAIPLCLFGVYLFYHFRRLAWRKLYPIELHLAVVLAKIHNAVKAKSESENVAIGVGSDP